MVELEEFVRRLADIFAGEGNKPTEQEVKDAYRVASAIGVDNRNDGLVIFLTILEKYLGRFKGVAAEVGKAAKEARAAAETVKRVLTRSVSLGVAGAMLGAALVIGGGGWWIWQAGKAEGIGIGRAESRNEELLLKERDAFTKTKAYEKALELHRHGELENLLKYNGFVQTRAFKWAYRLYGNGVLDKLRRCSGLGWQNREGICYGTLHYDEKGKVDGWEGWPVD